MKIVLLSKDVYGKWAGILGVAFVILITLKIVISLHLPTFAIAALGLMGLILGIIAICKKDYAILNFISILAGVVIVFWIAAEGIFPH